MTQAAPALVPAHDEPPLDPALPIIDPHIHLWDIRAVPGQPQAPQRFLLDEYFATLALSGHAITHSVFVQAYQMYRQDGPPELASLGETEFVNGIAAMSASGIYGPSRVAHRIVGTADLALGARVAPVLEAHCRAAGERFRGVRCHTAYSAAGMFGMPCDPHAAGVLADPRFREGAAVLAAMDLSLDIWCFHTQLAEVIALADALPQLAIVLDHLGTPETQGHWAGRQVEARAQWHRAIAQLAQRPNVTIKLGGIGMDLSAPIGSRHGTAPSAVLAEQWRPLVEPCIEAFGVRRAMFESNFPPDRAAGTYGAAWNAFKRIAAGAGAEERDWLFRRTAAATYRIAL